MTNEERHLFHDTLVVAGAEAKLALKRLNEGKISEAQDMIRQIPHRLQSLLTLIELQEEVYDEKT